jgi:hypothetical protein
LLSPDHALRRGDGIINAICGTAHFGEQRIRYTLDLPEDMQ